MARDPMDKGLRVGGWRDELWPQELCSDPWGAGRDLRGSRWHSSWLTGLMPQRRLDLSLRWTTASRTMARKFGFHWSTHGWSFC